MFQPVRYVRDVCRVDPSANHVALILASFTDRAGIAQVGIRKIADATGLAPNTVTAAIHRLESAGILAVDRRDRARSRYRFPVAEKLSTAVATIATDGDNRSVAIGDPNCRNGRHTLDQVGENKTHARAIHGDRDVFLPGTGWVAAYGGIAQ